MTDGSFWSRHLLLPCELVSAGLARQFVRTALAELDLEQLVDEVLLVASELATNATVHARTSFVVSVVSRPGVLQVRVRDQSPAVPILRHLARSTLPDDTAARAAARATGGRGLLLVSQFSSSWGVEHGTDGTKTVWASFVT